LAGSIALYHPSAGVRPKNNPFGKDVANVELFRAILKHGDFDQVDFHVSGDITAGDLVQGLLGEASPKEVSVRALLDQAAPARAGALVRGVPELSDMAWLRRSAGREADYSLVGMVHTLAPPAMREMIGKAATSPMQPWDALICTSPVVKQALTTMFDEWMDYLGERYGGTRRLRPHLPLLPLGVDGPRFAALADRPDARKATREKLGAAEGDVVVLWVGRLSFFEKAFPQPMLRAIEEAAKRAGGARVHFVQLGWFPDPATQRPLYEEAARAYAPSVVVHHLNGNDADLVGAMWAAADVFLSLVDNIQETFGITPLEAMAAGLPVVVSDWDGYRFTVRDGIDGFCVRTLGAPVGLGQGVLNRHLFYGMTYQSYVGTLAQHTAVHVGDAAARIADLVASPDLRAKMREAGRRRIAETFDWPVVVAGLQDLLQELAAIRGSAPRETPRQKTNPLKGEPFGAFSIFPTQALEPGTRLSIRAGAGEDDLTRAQAVQLDQFASGWHAPVEDCRAVVRRLADEGELDVRAIVEAFPTPARQGVGMALVWMCKIGLLDWR
jgi:glycosyltransferase involved in cell wall biosynthesis